MAQRLEALNRDLATTERSLEFGAGAGRRGIACMRRMGRCLR